MYEYVQPYGQIATKILGKHVYRETIRYVYQKLNDVNNIKIINRFDMLRTFFINGNIERRTGCYVRLGTMKIHLIIVLRIYTCLYGKLIIFSQTLI